MRTAPNPKHAAVARDCKYTIPAGWGVLTLLESGPLADSEYSHYVKYAVEKVEVILFCCALAAP